MLPTESQDPIASRDSQSSHSTAAVSHRKRRRARLVCLRCHEKKIKCDLQAVGRDEPRQCTNCNITESYCLLRPSRRGTGKHSHAPHGHLVLDKTTAIAPLPPHSSLDSQLVFPETRTLSDQNQSQNQNRTDDVLDPSNYQVTSDNLGPHGSSQLNHTSSLLSGSPTGRPDTSIQNTDNSPECLLASQGDTTSSYLGESGFMRIFSQDRGFDRPRPSNLPNTESQEIDKIPPVLLESFAETYFEYCYPWCPIIERDAFYQDDLITNSLLLRHAFALLGSQLEPAIIKHADPGEYYNRAKTLFYGASESNPLTCISALILFYWWGGGPPNTISMDTVWWWTGVAIRQAQQIGLHRELKSGQSLKPGETPGLRRRIWWTLFARERLSSLCQGRPCIIDPEDCNIREPSLEDFPEPRDSRAETFIYWVRLCAIIGRVGKFLLRKTESTPFPVHLAKELIAWVQSLPPHLQLPISADRSRPFNRDVHQLHLPYLSTITLLYLSPSAQPLPKAYSAAVIAACCVTRIFEDFLARGSIRFLHGMDGWYIAIAILALLHARQVEHLNVAASEHIKVLRVGLKEIAKLWHSSQMFDIGFERLLGSNAFLVVEGKDAYTPEVTPENALNGLADLAVGSGIDMRDYFPFATADTGPLIKMLLEGEQGVAAPFSNLEWPSDFALQLQGLCDNWNENYEDLFTQNI